MFTKKSWPVFAKAGRKWLLGILSTTVTSSNCHNDSNGCLALFKLYSQTHGIIVMLLRSHCPWYRLFTSHSLVYMSLRPSALSRVNHMETFASWCNLHSTALTLVLYCIASPYSGYVNYNLYPVAPHHCLYQQLSSLYSSIIEIRKYRCLLGV